MSTSCNSEMPPRTLFARPTYFFKSPPVASCVTRRSGAPSPDDTRPWNGTMFSWCSRLSSLHSEEKVHGEGKMAPLRCDVGRHRHERDGVHRRRCVSSQPLPLPCLPLEPCREVPVLIRVGSNAKALHVLQEVEFLPWGAQHSISSNHHTRILWHEYCVAINTTSLQTTTSGFSGTSAA